MDYRQNGDPQAARNTQTTDSVGSGNLIGAMLQEIQCTVTADMDTTRYLEQESVG